MSSRAVRGLRVAGLVVASFAAAFTVNETGLRLWYRGARRTLGGPGGQAFEYVFNGSTRVRGPIFANPRKRQDLKRILILGDSVTYGVGVRDWKDVYPYRLLKSLNRQGTRYEMQVHCRPAKEIEEHVDTLNHALTGLNLEPDIIVYQWYVNDIEMNKAGRPVGRDVFWRHTSFHEWLSENSYLYYFLDNRLETILPAPGRTYTQYLLEDFAEGTPKWARFRDALKRFATLATAHAERTIVLMYPTLPIRTPYHLQPIDNRVKMILMHYPIEVVDMLPHLQTFDTRVSIFEEHPNARAHAVIAQVLHDVIVSKEEERPPVPPTK